MTRASARTELELFHDHGILPRRSIIYIGSQSDSDGDAQESGVDHQMIKRTSINLIVADEKQQDITVILVNGGGDVYYGWGIHDAIRMCTNDVTIVVRGLAMSAAALILQAADKRIMEPNARLMIHDGEASHHDHARNIERDADEVKRLRLKMYQRFTERTGLHSNKIQAMCQFNTYMSAEEALKLNFIDEIQEFPARQEK